MNKFKEFQQNLIRYKIELQEIEHHESLIERVNDYHFYNGEDRTWESFENCNDDELEMRLEKVGF